jgi:hypothetical protein
MDRSLFISTVSDEQEKNYFINFINFIIIIINK